jgi:transcriptional regulator with XRE-family HTH domain
MATKRSALVTADIAAGTAGALAMIGGRIRDLRHGRGMTLQQLSDATNLSPSMLSLVERGRTGASIGTLIVISSALGVHMGFLLSEEGAGKSGYVARAADQPVHETVQGVLRRILCEDFERGIEIAINEYEPGTGNSPSPMAHDVGDGLHILQPGDLISYESILPHRLWNNGSRRVKAFWVNFNRSSRS